MKYFLGCSLISCSPAVQHETSRRKVVTILEVEDSVRRTFQKSMTKQWTVFSCLLSITFNNNFKGMEFINANRKLFLQ